MEDIIHDIIGGAVIMAVIGIVIAIFRNSNRVLRNGAGEVSDLSSITIEQTIGNEGSVYQGYKVAEAMALAKLEPLKYGVYVNESGSISKLSELSDSSYESKRKEYLATDKKYKIQLRYLSQYTSYLTGSNRQKNDLDITMIQIYFVRQ